MDVHSVAPIDYGSVTEGLVSARGGKRTLAFWWGALLWRWCPAWHRHVKRQVKAEENCGTVSKAVLFAKLLQQATPHAHGKPAELKGIGSRCADTADTALERAECGARPAIATDLLEMIALDTGREGLRE